MSKKLEFLDFIRNNIPDEKWENASDDVKSYWKALQEIDQTEKPRFTDNGKMILKYLQDHQDHDSYKAKDLGEALAISSRTVSGSIRKLVNDGYVDKVGKDPVLYSITEKGKNIEVN